MTAPLVVIGQVAPMSDDPATVLYPLPVGSTGHRLYRLAVAGWAPCAGVLGELTPERWLTLTWRFQLCRGSWHTNTAAREASRIVDLVGHHRPLLLLGSRVSRAVVGESTLTNAELEGAFIIPHPSGRNRAWTAPATLSTAVATVSRWLAAGGFPPSTVARRAPGSEASQPARTE